MDGSRAVCSRVAGLAGVHLLGKHLELHGEVGVQRTPCVCSSLVLCQKGWWVPSGFPLSN